MSTQIRFDMIYAPSSSTLITVNHGILQENICYSKRDNGILRDTFNGLNGWSLVFMEKNRILRDKMWNGIFSGFHWISREKTGDHRFSRGKTGFHGKKWDFTGDHWDFAGENERSWDFTGNYVILRSNAGFYRRIFVILREITGFYGIFILDS